MYLKSGIEAHFPKVIKGRMFRLDESNVGIIPSEFNFFSIAEDKIVSGDDLIGEKITFYYSLYT